MNSVLSHFSQISIKSSSLITLWWVDTGLVISTSWPSLLTPLIYLNSCLNIILLGDFLHLLEDIAVKGFTFFKPAMGSSALSTSDLTQANFTEGYSRSSYGP